MINQIKAIFAAIALWFSFMRDPKFASYYTWPVRSLPAKRCSALPDDCLDNDFHSFHDFCLRCIEEFQIINESVSSLLSSVPGSTAAIQSSLFGTQPDTSSPPQAECGSTFNFRTPSIRLYVTSSLIKLPWLSIRLPYRITYKLCSVTYSHQSSRHSRLTWSPRFSLGRRATIYVPATIAR